MSDERIAELTEDLNIAKSNNTRMALDWMDERDKHAAEVAALRAERDSLRRQNLWLAAAHELVANDDAFMFSKHKSKDAWEVSLLELAADGTPLVTLALNANDTFHYACADCEPFSYEDAPKLLEIAKREAWPGLARWMVEQRAKRGEPAKLLPRPEERAAAIDKMRERAEAAERERDSLRGLVKELGEALETCRHELRNHERGILGDIAYGVRDAIQEADAALSKLSSLNNPPKEEP